MNVMHGTELQLPPGTSCGNWEKNACKCHLPCISCGKDNNNNDNFDCKGLLILLFIEILIALFTALFQSRQEKRNKINWPNWA